MVQKFTGSTGGKRKKCESGFPNSIQSFKPGIEQLSLSANGSDLCPGGAHSNPDVINIILRFPSFSLVSPG
jgi:hypothetical protein